ncbi:hypothetical protein FOXYSP1_11757 [Fusarium oxysporum f. sp. phaseoli]
MLMLMLKLEMTVATCRQLSGKGTKKYENCFLMLGQISISKEVSTAMPYRQLHMQVLRQL